MNSKLPSAGRARRAAALFVVAGLLGLGMFLLWLRQGEFHGEAFLATFRKLNWGWVAAAAGIALLTYLGRALRWQVLLRPLQPHSSLWNLFTATAMGFTAIVLFGRPGELVRPYLIALKQRVSFSSQMAAWLLERIYDLLMALLIFGIALSQVQRSGMAVGVKLRWVLEVGGLFVAVAGTLSLVVLFALNRFSGRVRERLLEGLAVLPGHWRKKAEQVADAFSQGAGSTREYVQVAWLVGYSVLEWVLIVASYQCLFQALPSTAGLKLTDVLIFVGFVSFGCVVQIPGVGGGLQLSAIIVLTELYGLGLEEATGLAVVLWIITFVVIVPFGLVLAMVEGINFNKIRALGRQAELK